MPHDVVLTRALVTWADPHLDTDLLLLNSQVVLQHWGHTVCRRLCCEIPWPKVKSIQPLALALTDSKEKSWD